MARTKRAVRCVQQSPPSSPEPSQSSTDSTFSPGASPPPQTPTLRPARLARAFEPEHLPFSRVDVMQMSPDEFERRLEAYVDAQPYSISRDARAEAATIRRLVSNRYSAKQHRERQRHENAAREAELVRLRQENADLRVELYFATGRIWPSAQVDTSNPPRARAAHYRKRTRAELDD